MGGRLSMPKGPDGISESSKPVSSSAQARLARGRGIINGRTIIAPMTVLALAGLLFVYGRTSIQAAKLNAQKHREADGGQISWQQESRRRHGQLDRLDDDRGMFTKALIEDVKSLKKKKKDEEPGDEEKRAGLRSENDEQVKRAAERRE